MLDITVLKDTLIKMDKKFETFITLKQEEIELNKKMIELNKKVTELMEQGVNKKQKDLFPPLMYCPLCNNTLEHKDFDKYYCYKCGLKIYLTN